MRFRNTVHAPFQDEGQAITDSTACSGCTYMYIHVCIYKGGEVPLLHIAHVLHVSNLDLYYRFDYPVVKLKLRRNDWVKYNAKEA